MPTKKDFRAVASIIAEASALDNGTAKQTRLYVAGQLAELYARLNPNFDRRRFIEACGFALEG